MADRAVPALHGAVLDLEHHPHDLLAAVPRPQRRVQPGARSRLGIIHQPLDFLLFSDFAVIVAYVHLFTLFMVVPIFNSMARIDRGLHRGGARRRRRPLARHLGDRAAAVEDRHRARLDLRRHPGDGRLLRRQGHERRAERVGGLGAVNQISALQYPPAAASAVLLLIIVPLMVAGDPARRRRAQGTGQLKRR